MATSMPMVQQPIMAMGMRTSTAGPERLRNPSMMRERPSQMKLELVTIQTPPSAMAVRAALRTPSG